MKSKFKKLLATALVLCLVLALLPAAAFAGDTLDIKVQYNDFSQNVDDFEGTGTVTVTKVENGKYKVTATPGTGYGLKRLQVGSGADAQIATITDPEVGFEFPFNATASSEVTIYVGFRQMYEVRVPEITGGTVTATPAKAFADTPITLTIAASSGFEYVTDSLEVTNVATEANVAVNENTFTMPASDVTVSVQFEQIEAQTYTITCPQTPYTDNGYVTAIPSEAAAGATVQLTATANPGYVATQITVYESGATVTPVKIITESSGSFEMPAHDVTVRATFEEIETPTTGHSIITASNITGGTLDSDKAMASAKELVTITATPYNGYKTVEVYYILSGSYGLKVQADYVGYNQWQFTMPNAAVEVYATFKYDPYYPGTDYHYITVSNPGNHCSVSVPSGAYCGQNVEITLSNFDAGYAFSYLKVDGDYVTPRGYNGYLSYTFTMPHNNVAIEVGTTSVSGKYYIGTSYDSTLGGVEVWVNNNYVNNWHQGSWADYKDSVSFKVKPYYSDDVVSVSVVGKRTGWTYSYDYNSYSGWYTFTMPNEDVTINVDFRSGVHKVYVDKVTDGKLTVSDDWAKYGQIVYITAVPDYGCTLSSLSVRTATGDSVRVYNAQKADTYYFYMPDQYVSVSAVFTGKYTSVPFNDVSYGDWYYDAVQFVYSKGIMDGVDYYKFAPNGTITRGMILTMLWRMAGEPFEMPVTSFTDVEIGRYYTTAVAWACRNGIADGMGESTFGPNDAITREELVTLLYRYAQYFGHSCIGTSIEGFADAGSVSSYAYNAMCWAYKAGVVTGTTGSRLNPQGTASRAEAAQMIMSFYSFLNS